MFFFFPLQTFGVVTMEWLLEAFAAYKWQGNLAPPRFQGIPICGDGNSCRQGTALVHPFDELATAGHHANQHSTRPGEGVSTR